MLVMIESYGENPREVTLVREEIRVPRVRGTRILENDIGYVRITEFSMDTGDLFMKALIELQGEGMRGLVLDLRNNPGGLLSQAVEVSQVLLEDDALVVSTKGRDEVRESRELRAAGEFRLLDIPVVVLINEGSASASEIVAGALQDHRRAVVVGERSFGKASVQNIVPLQSRPDVAVRMTTAHYYTPAGRMIHGKGIMPDLEVVVDTMTMRKLQVKRLLEENQEMLEPENIEEIKETEDPILERAMNVLTALLVLSKEKEIK